MILFQVDVVHFGLASRVTALLTNVHLSASLLVGVLMLHAVHLEAVRLQRTALREALLAQVALVRTHAGVRARVTLQIEGVVEAFAAESAQIAFDFRVTLHVAIQQALQRERFQANATNEFGTVAGAAAAAFRTVSADIAALLQIVHAIDAAYAMVTRVCVLHGEWILNAMTAVDEFQLHLGR